MAKRKKKMPPRSAQYRGHYDVAGTITPETGIKLSLTQMVGMGAGIFFVAMGYAFLVWNQSATSKDVVEIKTNQTLIATTTAGIVKDQDEKRSALAKEFLASNEKIASRIGDLTTLVAVQATQQKSTDEKLNKVLDQIGTILQQAPVQR